MIKMKLKLSWHWFEIGLIVLSILLSLYIMLSPAKSLLNWYSSDDAFYYFKVAINVTSGHGLTFDGINRTNGFQPLWMLICIPIFALARVNLILPLRLLVLVSMLIGAGTGILLFRLLRKFISIETAAAVAILWVFLPSVYENVIQNGMESGISAFFMALLLYLVVIWREEQVGFRRVLILGTVAGLTILARLDNIFIVMLLGVWFAFGFTSIYLRTIVVGDLALIYIVGLLSYYFRLAPGSAYFSMSGSLPWLVGLGFLLKPLSLFLFGLYRPTAEKFSFNFLGRSVLAVLLPSGIIGICLLVFQRIALFPNLPRSVVLIDFAGTLLSVVCLRLLAGLIFREDHVREDFSLRSLNFWKKILPGLFGFFVPLGILMGAYMTWSYLYVGMLTPVSGEIKHWWGSIYTVYGSVVKSIPRLLGLQSGISPWQLVISLLNSAKILLERISTPQILPVVTWIFGLLIAGLVVFLFFSQRKWVAGLLDQMGLLTLFLGLYAHIFSYESTSYIHIRSWYWVGEMFFLMVCLGILLECARRLLERWRCKLWIWQAAMATLSIGVVALFVNMIYQQFPYTLAPGSQEDYLTSTHALEDSTEPGALIGMTGGGTVSYFITDRTIVNMDGLINSPEYFHLLRTGKGSVFLNQIGLDYVCGNTYMLTETDPYHQLLDGHIQEIKHIDTLTLYRYIRSQ